VFVKICGITNEKDALLAVAMGADAVGFVFAPSVRQIAPEAARDIVRRLPHETLTVGVFRDETPKRVVEIVNRHGLKGAQLHGHESPSEAAWVRERVGLVIKAFAAGDRLVDRMGDYDVDAVLVDSQIPGSGRVFDWSIAQHLPVDRPVILAGGLRPGNVAEAIAQVHPWGVDVSTGVEASPGRKDPVKVMRFVNAAKIDDSIQLARPTLDVEARRAALGSVGEDVYDYDWEDDATVR
jgi:phosphoribosylanthranilate isomerase